MCTIKEIREAIREDCSSQHDMDSAEIDRVLQALPFSQDSEPLTPQFFLQGCGFFHALRNERSEVNGRFSH